jgi:hypothetical protein
MKTVSWKAVIVASLFDIIASQLFALLGVTIVLLAIFGNHAAPLDAERVNALLRESVSLRAGLIVIGAAVSIVAGYLAAWIAKRGALVNGGLSSVLCVALGLYGVLFGATSRPYWLSILELPITPLLGVLGGYLYFRRMAPAQS